MWCCPHYEEIKRRKKGESHFKEILSFAYLLVVDSLPGITCVYYFLCVEVCECMTQCGLEDNFGLYCLLQPLCTQVTIFVQQAPLSTELFLWSLFFYIIIIIIV